MRKISKVIGIGTAAVTIGAFGAYALAQGPHGMGSGMGEMRMGMGHGPMGGRMGGQMGDPVARLAALKTELAITTAQEAAWSTYAKVVKKTAAERKAQHEAIDRDAVHKMASTDRQAFMTGQQAERKKAQQTVKLAAEQLLAVLDDAQKAKARKSLPGLIAGGPGMMRQGMMGGHRMGHGGKH